MNAALKIWVVIACVLSVGGCASGVGQYSGARHLSPTQCRDLAALRHGAPLTRERNASEMGALEAAGYRPEWADDDPYYPDDLQAAQRLVDEWYATECANGAAD